MNSEFSLRSDAQKAPVPGLDSDSPREQDPVPGLDSDSPREQDPVPGLDSDSPREQDPVPGLDSDSPREQDPVPGLDSDSPREQDPVPGLDSDSPREQDPVPGLDSDSPREQDPVPGLDSDSPREQDPVPGLDSDSPREQDPVPGLDSDSAQTQGPVPGLLYFAFIPPGLKPKYLRHMMSDFGEVGRVFIQETDQRQQHHHRHGEGKPGHRARGEVRKLVIIQPSKKLETGLVNGLNGKRLTENNGSNSITKGLLRTVAFTFVNNSMVSNKYRNFKSFLKCDLAAESSNRRDSKGS
ncbi:splicing factor 3A subunit 2-like [Carcharodon carcharias]|uniref:splicing factor 3A subunit 2-like n=1 Tax=Carcharodon carcharias TaxID=13397 RepID=UPI001B7F43CC|nr:splicing factor 3A subunit 2-like [Carcharodon carcharias]